MKTYLLALLATLTVASAAPSNHPADRPVSARERAQGFREDVVLAKPRAARRASVDADEAREGLRVRRQWDRFDGLRELELAPGETPAQAIARLTATGRYDYVQRDYLVRATVTPNDPSFSRQWGLANDGTNNGILGADIKATAAWDVRTDASTIVVAVIDSGVKLDHPDLAANLWRNPREVPGNGRDDDGNGYVDDVNGINAITNSGNPTDDHGHGTHVAGIVGAVGNNGQGISGVAWRVQLMALKFLRAGTGLGSSSDGIECIDYAIRHGAHIINASWGTEAGPVTEFNPAQRDAIQRARDAGIIFVAAAGNDGADMDLLAHYPASHRLENVISVGMSTNRDDLPVGTNYGSGSVELFAPGADIYSTYYTTADPYRSLSGTSMAAPHVAGALALLKAQFPADTYRQLINRVLRNVDAGPAYAGKVQTGGRLNLDRALRSADNRPFNDDFATRARVSGANLSIRNVSTGGTTEAEPAIAGHTGGATLWWEWTPATTAVVRVSTDGSSYDTLLGVFTGASLDALAPVAANDNENAAKTTSRLEFSAQAGVTYQIVVAGKGTASGLTLLDLGAIPPNDNFASAQELTGRSTAVYSANAQATLEAGEPRIRGLTGGKSLWYRWTAPAGGRFQFALKSDGFDPLLAVYTGTALNALTLVGASDNGDAEAGGTNDSSAALVTVQAAAGTTYHIQADGKATGSTPPTNAPFTLTLNDSLWQGFADSSITSAPVVGPDGAVYVGSTDGFFHAFNADGTRRWPALNFNEAAQDTSAAALSPTGTLYVGAGPTASGTTLVPPKLRAIDSATGAQRWEISVGTTGSANNAIALAADSTIYLHSDDGRLYAFTDHGASATQKWTAAIPGTSYASATIATDGTIYLGSDEPAAPGSPARHRLYAINPADGSTKWTFATDNAVYTAAAIDAAGNLYFGTLTSGRLYSVTPAGTERWRYTGGRLGTSSSPALSPDGATAYFAGYDGLVHAVNTATGAARWTFRLGKETRASSPAVDVNGVIYVGSYDSLLYAINADGTLKRTWSTGNIVRSSPAIAGTTLYVGSNDKGLYAFDIGAGTAGPWPQYRHNARRLGRIYAESLGIALTPKPVSAAAGAAAELSVLASGTGPLAYQWFKDGQPVPGATAAVLTLPALQAADTANYAVAVTGPQGTVLSPPAPLVVRANGDPGFPARLVNLSVRTTAGTAAQTLIVGFFVAGSPDKAVLLRAIGPSLTQFGVGGVLADPRLQLLSGATVLTTNDNWAAPLSDGGSGLAGLFAIVGAFPLAPASLDAAVLRTLGPGAYTAQVTGAAGTGVALAELYDTSPAFGARLANVSARSQVSTGGDILIAGFAITGSLPKTVLIRGIGPSLTPLGVTGVLADPTLALYQGAFRLAENDDWGTTGSAALAASFAPVGAFALTGPASKDAALLVTLAPGTYTAQVSGVGGATGVALVEVYELP